MEQPTAEDQLEALAKAALKEHEGGTMSLWEIEENLEEREYWKKIWKLGFSAAVSKHKEELSAKILPILESIDSCANSKLQEKEVEIAQHKKTHDFLVREGENIVEKHKSEIQKLHDHYQKQIGEWEERLKAADEFIRHVPLSGQDNVFGPNLYPTIGFIEALEKYESLKHQTPAPK